MAKRFKVQLTDITFTNGDDASNFLEGTEVTEIGLEGKNNLKTLDSFAKDCIELLSITPGIDFANIEDFDKMLYNTPNLKSVILKNVTSKGISLEDAFPFTLENITFSGSYTKEALQNIIDKFDWTFEEFSYLDNVLANIIDVEITLANQNKVSAFDPLEKKARYLELQGDSINNRSKDANRTFDLVDYASMSMKNGVFTSSENLDATMLIQNIDGNTYNNLLGAQGKGCYSITKSYLTRFRIPTLYPSTYTILFTSFNIGQKIGFSFTTYVANFYTISYGGCHSVSIRANQGDNLLYIRAHAQNTLDNIVISNIMLFEDTNVPTNIPFIPSTQSIGIQEGDNYILTIDLFNKDWDNL